MGGIHQNVERANGAPLEMTNGGEVANGGIVISNEVRDLQVLGEPPNNVSTPLCWARSFEVTLGNLNATFHFELIDSIPIHVVRRIGVLNVFVCRFTEY